MYKSSKVFTTLVSISYYSLFIQFLCISLSLQFSFMILLPIFYINITFFVENFRDCYYWSIGGNKILFFEDIHIGLPNVFFYSSYAMKFMIFSDLTFLYYLRMLTYCLCLGPSRSIYFLVAKPTVFFTFFASNFAFGSLLFKNLKTLGHLIGSNS